MTIKSKTFCAVPWVQVATNATGLYRICCNGIPGKNLLQGEDGKPMKVANDSLEKVWNSIGYKKIRQQFIDGERPEMCQRCFREEDSGVTSARLKANQKWSVLKHNQTIVPLDVRYLDLRLGNLCNLKCRMCNPYASSKWVDEWNVVADKAELIPNYRLDKTETLRLKTINWPEKEETWKNLEPILNTVEEIYLTGGEPFLSLEQTRLLKRLVESGRAKEIVIKYNTNLTVLPESIVNIWPSFKKIILNVSIDGIGPLDEYIRHPTKWNEVEKNLDKLFKLKQQGSPIEIDGHVTVQIYNILSLGETLDYLRSQYNIRPYLNILNHPYNLNIRTLPVELKEAAKERLKTHKKNEEVQKVISYMNDSNWQDKYFDQFIAYTKALDSKRSESLVSLHPEFSPYF